MCKVILCIFMPQLQVTLVAEDMGQLLPKLRAQLTAWNAYDGTPVFVRPGLKRFMRCPSIAPNFGTFKTDNTRILGGLGTLNNTHHVRTTPCLCGGLL